MQNSSNALHIDLPEQVTRVASIAKQPSVFTDIYKEEVNITIWRNSMSNEITKDINHAMQQSNNLRIVMVAASNQIAKQLSKSVDALADKEALCEHIEMLGDIFCTLFELKEVGLRLTTLDNAMCPKFHVDKIPCRLVTTLSGIATEWLPHENVDRSKLGAGGLGLSDETSGIMQHPNNIQRLRCGDVALLKGEGWYNNDNGGLVHRSPAVSRNEQRLVLTLDFIN